MAFLDSFWKKAEQLADLSAQNAASGINENLAEMADRLRRIETKQKETSIQLEEIDDFLQTGGSESTLVEALTALVDTIGDFYYFAADDEGSPLFDQAQLMWNAARNAAATAGLEIIDAGSEPFDFRLHSVESAGQDYTMPNGYVIRTLKCGYIYKDEIIRRAAVVVNKLPANTSAPNRMEPDTKSDGSNIIYMYKDENE